MDTEHKVHGVRNDWIDGILEKKKKIPNKISTNGFPENAAARNIAHATQQK